MTHRELHPSVAERLARLAPDQRAAATAPDGPVLCVAPAGSGKTTTLVARIAWLVARGVEPARITAVTFNRRAAEELAERLTAALAPLEIPGDPPRVRTFHALGREILAEAGRPVHNLVDRATVLAELAGAALPPASLRRLDDAFSRLKLDHGLDARTVSELARPPGSQDRQNGRAHRRPPRPAVPPDIAAAFVAYEASLAEHDALDFDDLVRRALELLRGDLGLLRVWQERCAHLLVDEVQDVDRSQLDLALLLAGDERRIFLVGDDDQTIYAWRLADVRRVISLAARLPGLRRVDLTVNYRCPAAVVERAVRLVAANRERFDKAISPRRDAPGSLRLAAIPADDATRARRILGRWLGEGLLQFASGSAIAKGSERRERWAVLARTNAELAPFAAVALEMGIPFSAREHGLLIDDPRIDDALDAATAEAGAEAVPLVALGAIATSSGSSPRPTPGAWTGPPDRALLASLVSWAAPYATLETLRAVLSDARTRFQALQQEDAPLVLATVHGTKGLEFDHVAVVGLDEGRFPSRRSIEEADDPARTLEEERRLAYVAWTRAKRSLTLVYDPGAPSPFLHDAFTESELTAG